MAQDQQTYQRAASAALVGLVAQLALGIGVALLGLYAKSPALHAATWHVFGGLPIWIILWVVFQQHRLERAEALETERLSRDAARTAALFDEGAEDLAVARRRLETLGKWWVPIISLAVASYLIIVGGTLFYLNYRAEQAGTLRANAISEAAGSNIVVTVVLVLIGFVAFLVARYVAGMTRVREWTLLRGGASYLMGVVAVAALLAAGAAFAYFDNTLYLALLALVIPAIMVLLGVEILLGFVFGLYRPRRPGEISRPAFDSRTLGLLTRPESLGKIINETINYQFGFEISRSWFYRLLAKSITPLIITGIVVLIGLTSLVFVAPQQQAVITRFGELMRITDEPGLHIKLPWPIERATKYDVYRVHEINVGSEAGELKPDVAILWTNQHTESTEQFLVTAPTRYTGAGGDEPADGDAGTQSVAGELIGARAIVKYRVSNLRDYITTAENPTAVLEQIATRRLTLYFAAHDVDTLLTRGRIDAGRVLSEEIQSDVDALNTPLGLQVVFVGFEAIHPPQNSEVAAKFHEQIDARQEKASAIQDAEKVAITTLTEIAGSRDMAQKIDEAIVRMERIRDELNRVQSTGGDVSALQDQLAKQEVEVEKLLDEAGGRAAQLIYEARAYRWQHALAERARSMKMTSLYDAYKAAPDYFRKRMYLTTVAESVKDRRKTVIAGDAAGTKDIRLNLETEESNLNSIFGEE